MLSRSARNVAGIALAALAMSSCLTGERPSFEDEGELGAESTATGDADIDLVLDRLGSPREEPFTAQYAIETKFGSLSSVGTVVRSEDGRLEITLERAGVTTTFTTDGDEERTCNEETGECESSLNDARISDIGIPHTFYGPSFAQRLRVSADRRIGQSTPSTKTIAGREARCVDVPVAGGTETFCALDEGILAEFIGNDVTLTLTRFAPTAVSTEE